MGVIHPRLGFVGAEIFKICFLAHNFGSRYARMSIKGSKVVDFCLVSKKLEPKNVSLVWHPGPGKCGQKNAKTPPLVTSPTENPKHKTKKVFFKIN